MKLFWPARNGELAQAHDLSGTTNIAIVNVLDKS